SRDGTVKTLITQATHCSTHVNTWKRHRTHTHTRRPEVVVNLVSAFSHPGLSFLEDLRSSGQLLSPRGPGEGNRLLWSRTDEECSVLFACFFCWGSWWRKPLVNTGRRCKLHTERPGR